MALELRKKEGKEKNYSDLYFKFKKSGIKPFCVISKFTITEQQRKDHAYFCSLFLKDWDKVDFLHAAASDELFIYTKSNPKNNFIQASNLIDITCWKAEVGKFPKYLGILFYSQTVNDHQRKETYTIMNTSETL